MAGLTADFRPAWPLEAESLSLGCVGEWRHAKNLQRTAKLRRDSASEASKRRLQNVLSREAQR